MANLTHLNGRPVSASFSSSTNSFLLPPANVSLTTFEPAISLSILSGAPSARQSIVSDATKAFFALSVPIWSLSVAVDGVSASPPSLRRGLIAKKPGPVSV